MWSRADDQGPRVHAGFVGDGERTGTYTGGYRWEQGRDCSERVETRDESVLALDFLFTGLWPCLDVLLGSNLSLPSGWLWW